MTPADALVAARALGVELTATADDRLRFRCRGPMPADLRAAVTAYKPGLLALLPGSARPL